MANGGQMHALITKRIAQFKMMVIGSLTLMATGHISPLRLEGLLTKMEKRELDMKPKIEMVSGPSFHLRRDRVMVDIG